MIAKIIAYGQDRVAAIRKMDAALANTTILGVTTNVRFLRDVLAHPVFQRGEITTNFIEREFAAFRPDVNDKSDLALIAAALTDIQLTPDLLTTHTLPGALRSRLPTTNSDPWLAGDGFRIGG